MIHGTHVIIYSRDAEADRAFFRDVLKYDAVDAGHGWLIFALPPSEVAVHPSEKNDVHELFLMCDDVHAFIAEMKERKVSCSVVDEQRWGSITRLALPGGGTLGVYQPKHPSPLETKKAQAGRNI
jgi:catechol 2,3-dioxygenase-like lactoylglutathione lyase family enzyme